MRRTVNWSLLGLQLHLLLEPDELGLVLLHHLVLLLAAAGASHNGNKLHCWYLYWYWYSPCITLANVLASCASLQLMQVFEVYCTEEESQVLLLSTRTGSILHWEYAQHGAT